MRVAIPLNAIILTNTPFEIKQDSETNQGKSNSNWSWIGRIKKKKNSLLNIHRDLPVL